MFMRVQSLAFVRFWRDRCLITPEMPRGRPITQREVLHFLRNALPAALKTEPVPYGDGQDNDPDEWAEAAKRALLEFVRALEEGRVILVEEKQDLMKDGGAGLPPFEEAVSFLRGCFNTGPKPR